HQVPPNTNLYRSTTPIISGKRLRAERSHLNRGALAKLQSFARSLKESASVTKSAVDAQRLQALAEILQRPSK
ncbi:MAG TPA: hypothetical protein VNO24_09400, partial [Blastocatellia bacterium]|nr:hypothetical protein [Blastocatellia bacterium]